MKSFSILVFLLGQTLWGQTPECKHTIQGNVHSYNMEACQQAVHGKLFNPEMVVDFMKIDYQLAHNTGDINLAGLFSCEQGVTIVHPDGSWYTPLETTQGKAQQSDLVLIGTVGESRSHENTAHTYLYTDYQIHVKEVLKQNPKAPAGKRIVMARLGGELRIQGRNVVAPSPCLNRFPLEKGAELLLYLKFIPESNTYRLERDTDVSPVSTGDALALARQAIQERKQ